MAYNVSACTDVTGFGLLGHLWEMIAKQNINVSLDVENIPFFETALKFARNSTQIPGGTIANYNYINQHVELGAVDEWYQNLLYDPQTSGGLLIGMAPVDTTLFKQELKDYPLDISVIGEVKKGENKIVLR